MQNFFDPNRRELNKLQVLVDAILALEPEMGELSDAALRNKTWAFRQRLAKGESLDDLLVESFAVVREASRRVLGMAHYPVQLLGGIVLHQGRIAEMCTGEGKTLVATCPAYLNALTGKGVHVVTTNDYLAQRDRDQMGQVHEFLGLSVGVVLGGMTPRERREAYRKDITYSTNSELGFDYLRDNMAMDQKDTVQRGLNYVILDEIDSILIDEARMPLIISGEALPKTKLYGACDYLARRMTCGGEPQVLSKLDTISGIHEQEKGDFLLSEQKHQVYLTEAGVHRTERFFRVENISLPENMQYLYHMDLALRANHLLKKDRDYVVQDKKVLLVDALTGRVAKGRQFSRGLHQAIEAKEKVPIQPESRTIASVSYQSFFNKYSKKSGMTGTGRTEEQEFISTYGMDVLPIPTNRPVLRQDLPDRMFRTKEEKYGAVCKAVLDCAATGRPVLVGTDSVAASEELSTLFREKNISHQVLNAKNHAAEAQIVAQAGQSGAVTIATDMAGRGTDIKLAPAAREAGGLLVIGTARHDSRRIDGQLRGRAGRQGDPGESRFYLSLEDELLRFYGPKRLEAAYTGLETVPGSGVIDPALSKLVEQAQKRVEADHAAQRKQLLEYDQVVNTQREVLYGQRQQVLQEGDLTPRIQDMLLRAAEDAVSWASSGRNQEQCRQDVLELFQEVLSYPARKACEACPMEELAETLGRELNIRYSQITAGYSDSAMLVQRVRELLLEAVDQQWREHLEDMEQLRRGIWLVSYAQKDPVEEYRSSAYALFEQMNRAIVFQTALSLLGVGELKVRS